MNYRDLQNCAAALLALLDAQPRQAAVRNTAEEAAGAGSAAAGESWAASPLTERRQAMERAADRSNVSMDTEPDISFAAERIAAVEGGQVGAAKLKSRAEPFPAFLPEAAVPNGGEVYRQQAGTESDMEAIDRFFRRDSRRYDNGFPEN